MDFSYWERCEPTFLDHDASAPGRLFAGEVIRAEVAKFPEAPMMLEFGFGGAVDYRTQFRPLVLADRLSYWGYDGCCKFVEAARAQYDTDPHCFWWCETEDVLGLDLRFDIVYAMSVLEHQPELERPLKKLLDAANHLAVIGWYRPPAAEETRSYNETDRVHYNTWRRSDVNAIAWSCGFNVDSHRVGAHVVDVMYRITGTAVLD